MLMWRKRQAAEIVVLLLQHGADPQCMVCITDHWEKFDSSCHKISLGRLLRDIAPTESLPMLRSLRELCSNPAIGYNLRRNQRRRAARSLQVFEKFYERLAEDAAPEQYRLEWEFDPSEGKGLPVWVVESVSCLRRRVCHTCLRQDSRSVLVMWCLDCGALSILCSFCLERNLSKL